MQLQGEFSKDELRKLLAEAAKHNPEYLRVVYPRRVVSPPGYANHMAVGVDAMGAMANLKARNGQKHPIDTAALVTAAAMVAGKFNLPTYYVSTNLADALIATAPPGDITLGEVSWPVPAATFMLPEAMTQVLKGVIIRYITIAYFRAGELLFDKPETPKIIIAARCWEDGQSYAAAPFFGPHMSLSYLKSTMDTEDSNKRDVLLNLGTVLLLALAARPDFVEPGASFLKKPPKAGHPVEEAGLWAPTWLGRHYASIKRLLGGSHASPRAHLRRGHIHAYWVGPGRTKLELKFIDPCWVNLDQEQESQRSAETPP